MQIGQVIQFAHSPQTNHQLKGGLIKILSNPPLVLRFQNRDLSIQKRDFIIKMFSTKTQIYFFFLIFILVYSNCTTKNKTHEAIKKRTVGIAETINPRISGSGILINPNFVITCNHVLHSFSSTIVIKRDTSIGEMRYAKLVYKEDLVDLALIQLNDRFEDVSPLPDSDVVSVGQKVISLGSPYSLENSYLEGMVSSVTQKGKDPSLPLLPFFQVQNLSYPGMSGAGVYSEKGKILGINRATYGFTTNTGIGFVIPWDIVVQFLELPESKKNLETH